MAEHKPDQTDKEEPEKTEANEVESEETTAPESQAEAEAESEDAPAESENADNADAADDTDDAESEEVEPKQAVAAKPEPEPEPDDELNEMTPEELEEARANEVAFSWQASEFVHHHKGPAWYAGLFGGLAVLVAGAALLHFWLEIVAFLAMGAAIMVYARKPPRTLTYELTPKGITIEGKEYPFAEFRSFGVLKDEDWHTIDLEPVKRFSPRITVLFDSDDFDSIVGHLELHLPRTDRDPDVIERAARYLRF